ncbi:hypothetical protein L1D22_08735 [Vibrio sp. Isolate34]|uniref:hypothetical protein n=1 Tax=Vibrio sp. Isolate34 TaxID=2908540 RepID=UPI001EFDE1EE|nr:hypothetical protein [Vibrio sp. Isolate34]MCG9639990.1 hypothetical protein [Vibrio sp. Isolate34]
MKHCPFCSTELIVRDDVKLCPRHDIGDCYFDGYEQHQLEHHQFLSNQREPAFDIVELSLTDAEKH